MGRGLSRFTTQAAAAHLGALGFALHHALRVDAGALVGTTWASLPNQKLPPP